MLKEKEVICTWSLIEFPAIFRKEKSLNHWSLCKCDFKTFVRFSKNFFGFCENASKSHEQSRLSRAKKNRCIHLFKFKCKIVNFSIIKQRGFAIYFNLSQIENFSLLFFLKLYLRNLKKQGTIEWRNTIRNLPGMSFQWDLLLKNW